MKTFKQIGILTISAAVLVLVLLWMQGRFTPGRIEPALLSETERPAAEGKTGTAEYTVMNQSAEAVGSIQSRSSSTIASQILATIMEVRVKAGDVVKRGDLLIRLDDRDLRARLQQAKNALDAAKATHEKTLLDKSRYESLLKTQAVTTNAYDEMASAERIASAKLELAQEQVNEAQVLMSYAQIFAPMDGTIVEKTCDPGDLASPGKPLLSMYDPQNLRIEAAVRERLSGRLKIGDTLPVVIDAVAKELTGTVEETVTSADPTSRSVIVRVAIPKVEGVLPGMFGRIRIPLDPIKYLVVPKEAVRPVGQLEMVTVLREGKRHLRAVRTGKRWNGDVEILSGLEAGEVVILSDE